MKTDRENLIELAGLVIEASVNWSGWDEEKIPSLKKLRTLAGYHLLPTLVECHLDSKDDHASENPQHRLGLLLP